jgi:Dolichyl-phosphate-mannose-protein mannosyltransferase
MELSPVAAPLRRGETSIAAPRQSAVATTNNARVVWLVAIFIAVLHAFMALTAVNTKSPTFDEPQHLTAGYSYWVTNDFRLDPENGNLPARWAALPLLFGHNKFVSLNDRAWQRADEGGTAHKFFYELGNDPDQLISQARLMMSIFGAVICLLIFRIGREFFGVLGGLVAEIIAAFDPNFLAHSALVTSDVPAALFFTATVWSCWRLFQRITPARLLVATLSLSGLFLTKFSAPIVLPVLGMISIWQILSRQEIGLQFGRIETTLTEKWKKASAIGGTWIFFGATAFAAIWLSFSFRYAAWTNSDSVHADTNWHWNYLLEDRGAFEKTVGFARDHDLLPEGYLYGFAYVHKHEIDRPAFLDNQWSIIGFHSFFPRAFLYKTSLPLLLLLALAMYAAIARRSLKLDGFKPSSFLPLSAFVFVYAVFALTSQLNIGHRHLLPIYPALFVGCGAVVSFLDQNRRAIFASAAAILLFWQIGESFAARPNYLAYLNQAAGGSSRGYEHLVDSSLDWGQDLPALKSWVDSHRAVVDGKTVYLAYFGSADPHWYGINAKTLPENHSTGDLTFAPLRRGVYCVSATTLQSVYAREIGPWSQLYEQQYQTALAVVQRYRETAPDPAARVALVANEGAVSWVKRIREFERLRFERLCAYLRHHSRVAEVGSSIFIFDLSDEEVDQALYGSPAELTPNVRVSGY